MNTPSKAAPVRQTSTDRGRRAAVLLAAAALALSTSGCFWVSRDAATLRNSVLESAGHDWSKQIEFGVGAWTLGAARFGLSFADLPPEATTALQAVHGAEVGVYRIHQRAAHSPGRILSTADDAMTKRGWERLVGVIKDHQLVAIYVPQGSGSQDQVRLCLAVFDGRQLVVVSAKTNLEPIMELALNRPDWKEKLHFAGPPHSRML